MKCATSTCTSTTERFCLVGTHFTARVLLSIRQYGMLMDKDVYRSSYSKVSGLELIIVIGRDEVPASHEIGDGNNFCRSGV